MKEIMARNPLNTVTNVHDALLSAEKLILEYYT
jgi:hypothetical protein